MRFNSKLTIVAGLIAGSVVSAHAQAFSFQSFGNTWSNAGANYTVAEAGAPSQYYNVVGLGAVTALAYNFSTGAGNTVTGAGTFNSTTYAVVNFTFTGTYSTTGLPQLAISDATATYTLPSGKVESGTLSDNLFTSGGQNYELNTLSAVPEPASYAVFALGGIGLLLRRRRS